MTKILIDKEYFLYLLNIKYGNRIKGNITTRKMLILLSKDVRCSIRMLYYFMDENTYSLDLLSRIITSLNISKAEFNKLLILKRIDEEL